MLRSPAAAALLVLVCGAGASAQVLDDALVPGGRLRLDLNPIFTTWESRFGRTATGETGREYLGEDLTTTAAHTLYPGAENLRAEIAALIGQPGYTPILGETVARVNQDVTRVELGASLGITDWLTIGATLPWTRTRANVDLFFVADTLGGDLGISPRLYDPGSVNVFISALSSAESSAEAYAAQTCSTMPGTPSCTAAQSLADRTAAFAASAGRAYLASTFFPIAGSSTAAALAQATAALSADLTAAGLTGISAPMVFSDRFVDQRSFQTLLASFESGIMADSLGSLRSLWHAGDMEVSATIRLLGPGPRGPLEPRPPVTFSLIATLLGRLPTGAVDHPDVFLDVGTGDGQLDLEGGLRGALTIGDRIGILAGGRYGIQLSRTLPRRVAPPETILAPLGTRTDVEWKPGDYWGLEVAPGFRFTDVLMVSAEYRVFRKYRDDYELAGLTIGASLDPSVLEVESGITLHEIGGSLRYDNVLRVLGGAGGWPLQLHLRFLRAVAGGGGQTPVTTRAELGVRFFRRLWGS